MKNEPAFRMATHEGKIILGDIEIKCAVLDDGTRIITKAGLNNFLQAMGSGKLSPNQITKFAEAFHGFFEEAKDGK